MRCRREILAGFIILVAFFTFRISLIDVPLERDEGEYAFISSMEWGQFQPYRDAVCQKPPIIFIIYKLAFFLFGESLFSIRIVLLIFVLSNLVIIFLIAKRLFGSTCAFISSLTYTILGNLAEAFQSQSANCEIFMISFLLIGFYLFITERKTFILLMLSGVFHSLAFFTKPVAFPLLVWSLILLHRRPKLMAAFLIGSIIPIFPLFIYFLSNRVLDEAFFWTFIYNFKYTAVIPFSEYYSMLFLRIERFIALSLLPILIISFVGFLLSVYDWKKKKVSCFLSWSLACAIGVCAGGFFRPHYFQQVLPSLSIYCGFLYVEMIRRLFSGNKRMIILLSALMLISIIYPAVRQNIIFWKLSPSEKVDHIFSGNPFGISKQMGSFLTNHTRPESSIFIFGSEPEFYFDGKRKNYDKFIITYPLFIKTPFSAKWRRDIITRMSTTLPDVIIVVPLEHSIGDMYYYKTQLSCLLQKLVMARYEAIAVAIPNFKKNRFEELTPLVDKIGGHILLKRSISRTRFQELNGIIVVYRKLGYALE